jgi:hypothetical protein
LVGFALFYEITKTMVPPEGGVAARWFSNVEVLQGRYPHEEISRMMGPSATLQQGKREVSDQFNYAWALSEDSAVGAFLATFRKSFAVVAFASRLATLLKVDAKHPISIVQPNSLLSRLRAIRALQFQT